MLSAGLITQSTVLKVGHHGSSSASSMAFLTVLKPQVAIYMAGLGNSYGHPTQVTLGSLRQVGATTYGTDVNGTILVTTDGNHLDVQTNKTPLPSTVPVATTSPPAPTTGSPTLRIISVTSPVNPGANATLAAVTSPGVSCSITVYYKSGPSTAAGLEPKTADSNGNVTWTWKVGTNTTPGSWRIVVTANSGSQSVSETIYFTVT